MDTRQLAGSIKAEVADIRIAPIPSEGGVLVDTNVLYFSYYDRFSQLETLGEGPSKYQTSVYSPFLKGLLSSGVKGFVHRIGLYEFSRTVETAELQILYCEKMGVSHVDRERFRPKELRTQHLKDWKEIQQRIVIYLHSIVKTFQLLNPSAAIDVMAAEFLLEWKDSLGDVGDAMMIAEAKREGIKAVLSDDVDIATFREIRLYTGNSTVLQAWQQKLAAKSG